jgi:hypothetical protein
MLAGLDKVLQLSQLQCTAAAEIQIHIQLDLCTDHTAAAAAAVSGGKMVQLPQLQCTQLNSQQHKRQALQV